MSSTSWWLRLLQCLYVVDGYTQIDWPRHEWLVGFIAALDIDARINNLIRYVAYLSYHILLLLIAIYCVHAHCSLLLPEEIPPQLTARHGPNETSPLSNISRLGIPEYDFGEIEAKSECRLFVQWREVQAWIATTACRQPAYWRLTASLTVQPPFPIR